MPPRKRPTSVAKAEELAYGGRNESQDTQQRFDELWAKYGIGQLSSSPRGSPALEAQQHGNVTEKNAQIDSAKLIGTVQDVNSLSKSEHASTRRPPVSSTTDLPPDDSRPTLREASSKDQAGRGYPADTRTRVLASSALPAVQPSTTSDHAAALRSGADANAPTRRVGHDTGTQKSRPLKRKMDSSGSPTQSNNDRSYEQYQKSTSQSRPALDSSQRDQRESQFSRASSSHRTWNEGDTGAVDLFHIPSLPSEQSQIEAEPHDEDDPSGEPGPHFNHLPNAEMNGIPPETPDLRSRLFQNSEAAPMDASQLFQQTQYTSAVKKASPTSSRPSPNIFNQNFISPNKFSSPLKDRGLRTSPLQESPTTSVYPATTPLKPADPNYSDPPHLGRRTRAGPEPISEYAPPRTSPPPLSEHSHNSGQSEDEESQDSAYRRHLAQLRRDRATKSLTSISFRRQSTKDDDIEVPSTSRSRGKLGGDERQAEPRREQDDEQGVLDNGDSGETVADSQSQDHIVTKTGQGTYSEESGAGGFPQASSGPAQRISQEQRFDSCSKETIPETSSPPFSSTSRPKGTNASAIAQSAAVPTVSPILDADSSPAVQTSGEYVVHSSPTAHRNNVKAAPDRSSVRRSGRLSQARVATPTNPSSLPASPPQVDLSNSSSLSTVPTPDISSSSVMGSTEDGQIEPDAPPSAAKAKMQRRTRLKRYSARTMRQDPEATSTDEFTGPSSSLSERGRSSRDAKPTGQHRRESAHHGLFSGMTFAICFQPRLPHESLAKHQARIVQSNTVKQMILKQGGRLLMEGFHELFEIGVPSSPATPIDILKLDQSERDTGFTALIADGHSRKVKYMQALALGLPCLAWKWISACISKDTIVDWSSYILCAGESGVLGAIRSRSLVPYDAETAKLQAVLDQRPRLLGQSDVLWVMKRTKNSEEKRAQFAFLTQALGAELIRAFNVDEARQLSKQREDAGRPFNWVYVDEQLVDANLFGTSSVTSTKAKKRKRQSRSSTMEDEQPLKRIRALTNDLVVQSLILGRLVEEGELDG